MANELFEIQREEIQDLQNKVSILETSLDWFQELIREYEGGLHRIRVIVDYYGNRKGRVNMVRGVLDELEIKMGVNE